MKKIRLAILAGVALLAVPANAALNLTGASVTVRLFYPDLSTTLIGPLTATVGAGTEFPFGSFSPSFDTIDIGGNTVRYNVGQGITYAGGAFNGYRLDFTGFSGQLSDLQFDPASTFTPLQFNVVGNSVFLNLSGQSVAGGDFAQLIAAAGPGVPEPAAWLLMLGGFGMAGAAMRRRRGAVTRVLA